MPLKFFECLKLDKEILLCKIVLDLFLIVLSYDTITAAKYNIGLSGVLYIGKTHYCYF